MPPFHSTAARGTLPIEQTNETIATMGPMIGPHSADSVGWSVMKKFRQNDSGTHAAMAPAMNNPRMRSQDRRPLHDKHVRHRGEAPRGTDPPPKRSLALHGHVHRGVAFH